MKTRTIDHNGHRFKITWIEGSDRFSVVRNDREVRYISNQALQVAISNGDLGPVLERLFNDESKGGDQ